MGPMIGPRATLVLGAVLGLATLSGPARAERCDGPKALATVRELCAALAGGPDAAVRARLRLPLRVRAIASEGGGNPTFRTRTLTSIRAVRAAGLCADADLDAATVAAEDATQIVSVPRGQFAVAFSLVARGDRCVVFRVDDR